MSAAAYYWIHRIGTAHPCGPLTADTIRHAVSRGRLSPDDRVASEREYQRGAPTWLPLHLCAELVPASLLEPLAWTPPETCP